MKISASLVLAAAVAAVSSVTASAQGDVAYDAFSPYSMYALGILEPAGSQNNLAMGGIGIADRNSTFINLLNPAAVTAREDKTFMLDFGLSHKDIFYTADAATTIETDDSGTIRSVNNMFNIHHIVASFPIGQKAAFKLGVMPFSATGYKFVSREYSDEVLLDMGNVQYLKEGKGGVYQCLLGAGWEVFKNFNIGVDGMLYLGNTVHSSTTSFTTNTHYRTLSRDWNIVARGAGAKAGLQYTVPFKNNLNLTLGATYKLSSTLNGEHSDAITAATSTTVDTLASSLKNVGYSIPSEVGAGFTLRKTGKWMFGMDWTMQDWSKSEFDATPGIEMTTCRQQSFKIGGEVIPNKYDIRYYFKRVTYRAGLYYNQGYIALDGIPIDNKGITFGAAFPVYRYNTSMSMSLDLGQMGTLSNNLIRERYLKLTFGVNLIDIWFQKSLYN